MSAIATHLAVERTADPGKLYQELQRRIDSAQRERARHETAWDNNTKLVMGEHRDVFDTGKHHYFVVNRVRQIVDTHVAVLTETEPRLRYDPHEVGEPPDWLIKPEAVGKLQFAQQIVERDEGQWPLDDAQMQSAEFIDDATARALLSITQPQSQEVPTGTQHPETGAPQTFTQQIEVPILTEDDFWIVDNQLEADALTQEVKGQWRTHARGDSAAKENIFESQVVGHCDWLPQWDGQRNTFTLSNLYPYNVWIDPLAWDTTDAEYYIVREFMSVEKAKTLWPEEAEYIERHAAPAPTHASMGGAAPSGAQIQHAGNNPTVSVWTWWQRNHPFEMAEDEAVERGLVQPAMQEVQQEATDPESGEVLRDPETDEPLIESGEAPVQTEEGEQVYQLLDGEHAGALVMPGDERWPKRYGIRQIQFLHDRLVFDAETDFADIPAGRTKCMLIHKSPHGQGQPQRVSELVDLYNRLWSIYHGYVRRFRSPEQLIPADVYQATKDAVQELHADASKKWIIPSILWQQYNGQVIQNLEPPQLGPVMSEMMRVIDGEIDKVSGMSDVLRGETKSDQSGELFRLALEAARGPIGLEARNFGHSLRHVGTIIARLIIDFMPPQVWAERNRKYPVMVFQRIQERLRRHGVNVVPEVSGSGTREQKIRQLQELWNSGVQTPTVLEDLCQQMGVADSHKIVQEWQQLAMSAAQGAP